MIVIIILAVIAFFGLIFLLNTFFVIEQQTVAVIERFGKFSQIKTAGLNVKIPFIDRVAGVIELRVQQMNVEVQTKTKDNVFVDVPVAVQYHIISEKAYDSYYKLQDAKTQIAAYVFDAVRSQVPKMSLDEVFEKKEDIAKDVKESLEKTLDDFGYKIVTALVTDIDPAANVKAAMNEINAQTRLREAATAKADANKIILVKNAEAEAESKKLQGKGIADQRKAIIDGLKDSVQDMAKATGIDATEVMSLVLMTQYFDTIKEAGAQKVILMPHSPAGMTDLKAQIVAAMEVAK